MAELEPDVPGKDNSAEQWLPGGQRDREWSLKRRVSAQTAIPLQGRGRGRAVHGVSLSVGVVSSGGATSNSFQKRKIEMKEA